MDMPQRGDCQSAAASATHEAPVATPFSMHVVERPCEPCTQQESVIPMLNVPFICKSSSSTLPNNLAAELSTFSRLQFICHAAHSVHKDACDIQWLSNVTSAPGSMSSSGSMAANIKLRHELKKVALVTGGAVQDIWLHQQKTSCCCTIFHW